jgi:N-acetyl-anhydromuramyl-L-alanine amidase AmpD
VIWIPARNYTPAWRSSVDLVVIHSTESPRRAGAARAVARWFAGSDAPMASAHYIVDDDQVIQCVSERNVAWAAPGANHNGVQIELVGYARHSAEQWLDGAVLARASELVAKICKRWAIPVALVSSAELLDGQRGITTHASVSQAWHRSTHWDPGLGFPIGDVIRDARAVLQLAPLPRFSEHRPRERRSADLRRHTTRTPTRSAGRIDPHPAP